MLEVLAAGPSTRLLDLGCGTGEHARFLVEQGFEVVGIDRSESMLEKALDQPLPAGLELLHGDLAEIAVLVEGPFGGAICLGNTLPHLLEEDVLRSLLRGLRKLLGPGAPLIIQLLNYQRIFQQNLRYLPLNFRQDEDGEIVFLRLMELDEDGRVVFYPSTLKLLPDADPPLQVKAAKKVLLQGWQADELDQICGECGFVDRQLFGSFDRQPFEPQVSNDLIVVAR